MYFLITLKYMFINPFNGEREENGGVTLMVCICFNWPSMFFVVVILAFIIYILLFLPFMYITFIIFASNVIIFVVVIVPIF